MDNYKQMMDTEHREEIEALSNEWANERKVCKIVLNIFSVLSFFTYFRFIYFWFYLFAAKCTFRDCWMWEYWGAF